MVQYTESTMFQPLVAYGFELFPSSIPLVEPPPPASTNSVPAPAAAFLSCTQWASDPARRRPTRLRRLSRRTVQRHEPGCGDWPYSGFGCGDLPDRRRAVLLQNALAYRTGYQSRSTTRCRRKPLSSRQITGCSTRRPPLR